MTRTRGRLLLVAPEAAARCLSAELAADWQLDSVWAAAGLLDRLKALISKQRYAAVLLADAPAVRACLPPLRQFTTVPLVCLQLEGRDEPAAAAEGTSALARLRARKAASDGLSAATEVWSFAGPRLERAWLTRRLSALRAPAAPKTRGLTSIVIPCLDKLRYTRECLAQLARHTSGPYELIVVDNGSKDGTAAFLARQPRVRLIRNKKNLGFAKAINQGMRAARGRYVVWLNNDAVVTPGWLEGLIACAERSPAIGAVGPCTNEAVGYQRVSPVPYKDNKGLLRFSQAWAMKNRGRSLAAHRLTGFCLLLKREAVRQVGLLDERFTPACYEDYDYCLRLRQAGYDLACALDVFVHHHGHKSYKSDEAMLRQAALSRDVFLDKWCHQTLQFLDELDPEASKVHDA